MVVLICHSLFSNLLETNAISHYDTCVQVYIKITFRLKYLPLDGIFHIFGRPEGCEGLTKRCPATLFNMLKVLQLLQEFTYSGLLNSVLVHSVLWANIYWN